MAEGEIAPPALSESAETAAPSEDAPVVGAPEENERPDIPYSGEQFADVGNGVKLCYDVFGAEDAPLGTLVLVMGLGGQMIIWHKNLVYALVDKGYRVVRFDNRDVGLSTKFDALGKPVVLWHFMKKLIGLTVTPGYTLDDMAADVKGLVDHLGIDKVHIAGASMGGMISQLFAIHYPERTRSLVSIMSTTGDSSLPNAPMSVNLALLKGPGATEEEVVHYSLEKFRTISSPHVFDEARFEDTIRATYNRSFYPEGSTRQLHAIIAARDRTPELRRLEVPAVVVHGAEDPLILPAHGRATAEAIPGAEYVEIPKMGHDLQQDWWGDLIDSIVRASRRALEAEEAQKNAPEGGEAQQADVAADGGKGVEAEEESDSDTEEDVSLG